MIERAVILASDDFIGPEDLQINNGAKDPVPEAALMQDMTLAEAEQYLIQSALQKHEGNVANAAQALGLTRSSLYRRLDKFGIKA